jgi:glycosyltransferase involved in cell wall biosynthesis
MYREGNVEQIKRLAKNVEVIKYTDKMGAIKCKRFFCNYGLDIPIEAEEKYHIIHCDYKKVNFRPIMYDGFKYIAVSKLAKQSFEEITGEKAELIYNPVVVKKKKVEKYNDGKIHILVASRLSPEKGGNNILKLASLSDDIIIDLYSNKKLFPTRKNIIKHDTKLDLTEEMQKADYVAQLSSHEAFGLTVAESLMLGTPVIVTDIPAFREIGCIDGVNSLIFDVNMTNLDYDKIKKGVSEFEYTPPKSNWGKYLSKKGTYNPNEKIKVRLLKRLWLVEEDIHYKFNDIAEIRKQKVSELECEGIVERL